MMKKVLFLAWAKGYKPLSLRDGMYGRVRLGLALLVSILATACLCLIPMLLRGNDTSGNRAWAMATQDSPGAEKVGRGQEKKFQRDVAEYETFVASLKADVEAYRSQFPVFDTYLDVLNEKIGPAIVRGEIARLKLIDAKAMDPSLDLEQLDRDVTSAEMLVISWGITFIEQGQEFFSSEMDRLQGDGSSAGTYDQLALLIDKYWPSGSEVFEVDNPYPEGTLEYELFLRCVGQAAEVLGTQYLIIAFGVHLGYAGRMARMARIVAPGLPHHITQRGNRRMKTFLREEDYASTWI